MDDFISRKAAKEAAWEGFINHLVEDQGMYGYLVHLVDEVFDAIPAADVQPVVRGKWIGYPECLKYANAYSDDHIVCSACEECFSILDNDCERFNFCPNCGADMREES